MASRAASGATSDGDCVSSGWRRNVRTGAGANSTMMGEGFFQSGGVAATANSGLDLTFGGTSCLFDSSVRNFFTFQNMSYGAALAWLLFGIILVVTVVLFRTSRRWVYYAGER